MAPKNDKNDGNELVDVLVKKTIVYDGRRIGPGIDDSRRDRKAIITPVAARIPRRVAEAAGPDYVTICLSATSRQVVAPAAASERQMGTPANKQQFGSRNK
jgi:hypothetical protein